MDLGKFQERQPRLDRPLHQLALISIHRVPFVHRQHHGAAGVEDEAGDVRVLVGHALLGVDQQQHHVGRFDGLQRLDDRKLLDRLEHLALAAQAGGVDQLELLAIALKLDRDGIARGARQIKGHQALFAQPGVDEGGFADVGAPRHRQADGRVGVGFGLVLRLGQIQGVERGFQHAAHALAVRGRDGNHLAQTQFIELGQLRAGAHALGLVGHQQRRLAQAAQVIGDVVVLRRQAVARIDHEDDHIGLGHRLARLLGHFLEDARFGRRLEAAGVDDDVFAVAQPPLTIVPVARQPRKVGHDGIAAFRQPVEQRGFAHIGPPHQRDHGFHRPTFHSRQRQEVSKR